MKKTINIFLVLSPLTLSSCSIPLKTQYLPKSRSTLSHHDFKDSNITFSLEPFVDNRPDVRENPKRANRVISPNEIDVNLEDIKVAEFVTNAIQVEMDRLKIAGENNTAPLVLSGSIIEIKADMKSHWTTIDIYEEIILEFSVKDAKADGKVLLNDTVSESSKRTSSMEYYANTADSILNEVLPKTIDKMFQMILDKFS